MPANEDIMQRIHKKKKSAKSLPKYANPFLESLRKEKVLRENVIEDYE